MTDSIWQLHTGDGALIASAIHDGHAVREELRPFLALDDAARLREEDPFTGRWTQVAPTRVIGTRSRFEVDLNRPRDQAVYRTAEDAWGLTVWSRDPDEACFRESLAEYDDFYQAMESLFREFVDRYGHFVVFDLHSYNHRRRGPHLPAANERDNPQVNVGTGTLNRERWGPVVDAFIDSLRAYDFPGGRLDVRENVKFRGGNWPRWIHEKFPEHGLAIAIELKKFFMDEWTGEPDEACVGAILRALQSTVPPVLDALRKL